jgi:hypothetical protein
MTSFCLDGSALAKRYVPETGSVLVDFILDNVPEPRLCAAARSQAPCESGVSSFSPFMRRKLNCL